MGLDLRIFGTFCSCLVAIRLGGRKNRCPFSGRAIAPTLPFTVNLSSEGSKNQNRSDLFNVGYWGLWESTACLSSEYRRGAVELTKEAGECTPLRARRRGEGAFPSLSLAGQNRAGTRRSGGEWIARGANGSASLRIESSDRGGLDEIDGGRGPVGNGPGTGA